jgi:hypothetical protein
MSKREFSARRWSCAAVVTFVVAALASVITATSANAAVSPVADRSKTGVTADALPTVQTTPSI